jgi:phage shock protein PspC (stress-responsive transcriptional regulator)
MQTTTTISLNKQAFTLEEPAYALLKDYLHDLKAAFAHTPARDEIIQDLEERIAELLRVVAPTAESVVTTEELQPILKKMGTPAELAEETGAPKTEKASPQPEQTQVRRLYRDTEHGMAGGVAAGLGAYFGLDPIWFRLGFVALGLGAGSGFLLYFVMWVLLPEATTPEQKRELFGRPVTAQQIVDEVTQRAQAFQKEVTSPEFQEKVSTEARQASTWLKGFLQGITPGVQRVIVGILSIIGCVIAVSLALTIGSLIIALIALLLTNELTIGGFVYHNFPQTFTQHLLVLVAFGAIVTPIGLLLAWVIGLLRRQPLRGGAVASFLALWVLLGIATSFMVSIVRPTESGMISDQAYSQQLGAFRTIETKGNVHLTVRVVPNMPARITINGMSDEAARDAIREEADTLVVQSRSFSPLCWNCQQVRGILQVPSLEEVTLHDVGYISLEGEVLQRLTITTADASRFTADRKLTQVTLSASDASEVTLAEVDQLDASVHDAARVKAFVTTVRGTVTDAARLQIPEGASSSVTTEDAGRVSRFAL